MKRSVNANHPTQKDVVRYQMLYPMLFSALEEMRTLTKKNPDSPLNPLKIQFINHLLTDVRQFLDDDASNAYLTLFDGDLLPLNSDAVLVLGRYVAAMDQFKNKHYNRYDDEWITQD